jgi:transposase
MRKDDCISKQGNPLLRWLLVEAASAAQKYDPSWHRQYLRLSMTKHHGKVAHTGPHALESFHARSSALALRNRAMISAV